MTYVQFNKQARLVSQDLGREMLESHRGSIRTKKEPTAVKNLQLIFDATLKVSNLKGFSAMTMRDLSQASGLSMGALYAHFSSKEELLEMVQSTGRKVSGDLLRQGLEGVQGAQARLAAAIRTHVFVSETMQTWFFFSFMEARHLGPRQKELAKQSELTSELMLAEIIREGQREGVFAIDDPEMAAALIKALLQDWYVKRWKYASRRVKVDAYADAVVGMAMAFCRPASASQAPRMNNHERH